MTVIIVQEQSASVQTVTIVKDSTTRIILVKDGEVMSTDPREIYLCKALIN